MTTPDRPLLGVLLMLGFCVLAPLGDGMAKLIGTAVALPLLVMSRFAVQALVLAPMVLGRGGSLRAPAGARVLIWTRTVLHVAGMALMFAALRHLPLADALAIAYVMPFVVLILGRIFLSEAIGPHRVLASLAGFGGTLLVIRPNFAEVGAPALLPLGVALTFALFMLVTRALRGRIEPVRLQAIGGIQATGALALAMLLVPGLRPELSPLPGPTLALVIGMGLVGTLAHLLMTWSLRLAPASTLAPMQYLEIPLGALIGWLMFRELPDGLAAVGIAITVAAGLYVIARERSLSPRPGPVAPA